MRSRSSSPNALRVAETAAPQMRWKWRVARRLELRVAFLRDALHVAHRDEAVQMVVVVHHQQFVDADVLGEKFVGAGNRVLAQFLFRDGVDLRARRQRLGNFLFGVTRLDDVAGKQADQLAFFIHDRKRAEAEFFLLNQRQHVADELVGRDLDGFLNQAVDVVLDAADFGKLLAFRHVVMDEAEAAVERHGDGHARFGHRVHVGRNDRDVQVQIFRERGVELRVARKDFGIKRRQRDVVERQADFVVCREKLFRRLVERIVEGRNCALLPCRKMKPDRRLWQANLNPSSVNAECNLRRKRGVTVPARDFS